MSLYRYQSPENTSMPLEQAPMEMLHSEKHEFYDELKDITGLDFLAQPKEELISYIQNANTQHKQDISWYILELTRRVEQQIERLKKDTVDDAEQGMNIETLSEERSKLADLQTYL